MTFSSRIVLAHDSLTQLGGAERVLAAMHEMYPSAPLFTLVKDSRLADKFRGWHITTSRLQFFYGLIPRLQYWLLLIPWAVGSLRLPEAKVVLSSSSFAIKGLRTPSGAVHINYCHTPTRFLWTDREYVDQEVPALLRPAVKSFLNWLKGWDLRAAARVDYFIANSLEVQQRIQRFYGRESVVIQPFVDTNFWHPTRPKQNYFLIGGRLQAHKANEIIIELFNELGWELHVVGTGRREERLRAMAKPNVKFFGRVSDEALRDEYSGARGFIFPHVEDFGLMPLEAAACGTPTLAQGRGGALETVVPGVTGQLFPEATINTIKESLVNWGDTAWDAAAIQSHAAKFSKEVFQKKLGDFVEAVSNKEVTSNV